MLCSRAMRCSDQAQRRWQAHRGSGAGQGVGLGHGWAPCVQAEAATDKGGGRCVVRNPAFAEPAGTRPHAPPAIAGRRIASRHHRVMPAGKRLLQRTTGVSNPGHPFPVARKEIRPVVRDANAVRPMPSPQSTFSESLHMAQWGRILALQGQRRCWLWMLADCWHPPAGVMGRRLRQFCQGRSGVSNPSTRPWSAPAMRHCGCARGATSAGHRR